MQFDKLKIERNNVMLNVVGLASYIYNNKEYKSLKLSYRLWMNVQLLIMRIYLFILNKRLSYGTNTKRDFERVEKDFRIH